MFGFFCNDCVQVGLVDLKCSGESSYKSYSRQTSNLKIFFLTESRQSSQAFAAVKLNCGVIFFVFLQPANQSASVGSSA